MLTDFGQIGCEVNSKFTSTMRARAGVEACSSTATARPEGTFMNLQASSEVHDQLCSLYQALLSSQSCFDEFKRLLRLYDFFPGFAQDREPSEAAQRRCEQFLNDRHPGGWIGGDFAGLTVTQTLQWREIIVEERFSARRPAWRFSTGN